MEVDNALAVGGELVGGGRVLVLEHPLVGGVVIPTVCLGVVAVHSELGTSESLGGVACGDLLKVQIIRVNKDLILRRIASRWGNTRVEVLLDTYSIASILRGSCVRDLGLVGDGQLFALMLFHELVRAGRGESAALSLLDRLGEHAGHVGVAYLGVEAAVHVAHAGHGVGQDDGVGGEGVGDGERNLEVLGLAVVGAGFVDPLAFVVLHLLVGRDGRVFNLGAAELNTIHAGRILDGGGYEDRDALRVDDEVVAFGQGELLADLGGVDGLLDGDAAGGLGGGGELVSDLEELVAVGLELHQRGGGGLTLAGVVGDAVGLERGRDPLGGRVVGGAAREAAHVAVIDGGVVVFDELVGCERVSGEGAAVAGVDGKGAIRSHGNTWRGKSGKGSHGSYTCNKFLLIFHYGQPTPPSCLS